MVGLLGTFDEKAWTLDRTGTGEPQQENVSGIRSSILDENGKQNPQGETTKP